MNAPKILTPPTTPATSQGLLEYCNWHLDNDAQAQGFCHYRYQREEPDTLPSFLSNLGLADNKANRSFGRIAKDVLQTAAEIPATVSVPEKHLIDRSVSQHVKIFLDDRHTQQFIAHISKEGAYSHLDLKKIITAFDELYTTKPCEGTSIFDLMKEHGDQWYDELIKLQAQVSYSTDWTNSIVVGMFAIFIAYTFLSI